MLIKTKIKPNLYYEIKNRVDEEVINGITMKSRPKKVKVYGCTSNHTKRNQLIDLLHQRVQHHRDKFLSKDIYDELCTMVVKPNGKVEHADDAHDDLVFSYLWALYVFYFGEELPTRFHLIKTEIFTDDHYDETSYSLEEEYSDGTETLDPNTFKSSDDPSVNMIEEQLKVLNTTKNYTFEDYYKKQFQEEANALNKIKQTKYGREAISKAYHVPVDQLEKENKLGFVDIGADMNRILYGDDLQLDENGNPLNNKGNTVGNLADLFNRLQ